jgi:hypothetical protein
VNSVKNISQKNRAKAQTKGKLHYGYSSLNYSDNSETESDDGRKHGQMAYVWHSSRRCRMVSMVLLGTAYGARARR